MSKSVSNLQIILVVLIIIAIVLSGASYVNTMGLGVQTEEVGSKITSKVDELSSKVGGLTTASSDLTSAVKDLGTTVGKSAADIAAIQERLKKLEETINKTTPTVQKVVLRIGLGTAFETTDPPHWQSDLLNGFGLHVTETLTRVWDYSEGQLVLQPVLAESWEQKDPLTWIFHLRKGVKFSDGSDFTAKDVWFSIWGRQTKRPENFLWSIDARVKSLEIIDDYTIQIVTQFMIPNFPVWVAHGWDGIMSYEQVKRSGQENEYMISGVKNVLGTGPYMWTELEPNLYAKMSLNPNWRGVKPQITDVEFYYLPDDEARVAALESGSVDYIHPVPVEQIERLRKEGFTIWEAPSTGFENLALNNIKAPLNDSRVRKALAYAINYNEMLTKIYGDFAIRPYSVVPLVDAGYKEFHLYDYDPVKAKQLLADAGYPNGFTIKLAYRAGMFPHVDEVVAAIQGYFRNIGVNLDVDILERSVLNRETIFQTAKYLRGEITVDDIKYHLFPFGWSSDTLWSGDTMYSLYRSNSDDDYWYYFNPEVDKLILFSMSGAPLDERINAAQQAQEIMMKDCAMIPFYASKYVSASSPRYTGHKILPNIYEYFLDARLILK